MEAWLQWARGPLFWTCLTFLVAGLARHLIMTAWGTVRILHRAGDKRVPVRQVATATLRWLVPVNHWRDRWFFSLTTLIFHLSIVLATAFLAGHIELWKSTLGFSWPALPNFLATTLTVVALATALALVAERVACQDSRSLSRLQDYMVPLVVALPVATGLLVMHPAVNPFPFQSTLLVHVLSADLLLVLIPLTKLSHIVLLPVTQLVSELAWHFPPDAGSKVAVTLGKEGDPI